MGRTLNFKETFCTSSITSKTFLVLVFKCFVVLHTRNKLLQDCYAFNFVFQENFQQEWLFLLEILYSNMLLYSNSTYQKYLLVSHIN